MGQVELRPGSVSDAVALYQLDLLCFQPPFRFDLRMVRRCLASRNAVSVLAEDGPLLIGAVILEVARRPAIASAYVVTLDVHPDYRRAGLARSLMQEAERRALALGVNHVRLHVYAGNQGAIRFYEAYGYQRMGVVADFYGPGLDAFRYLRRITA